MSLSFTNLCFLASDAAICVFSNVELDVGPPVVPGDELLGLVTAWVSSGDGIMVCSDDIFAKLFVFRDIEAFLPFDHGVGG